MVDAELFKAPSGRVGSGRVGSGRVGSGRVGYTSEPKSKAIAAAR
jgi:hypothetical protein